VGQGASGITIGDGAVWVADTLDNALVRIDPATDSVTTTIPVGTGPHGVAWGDGSLWVTNSGDGTVSVVDPQTGRVTSTIPVGQSPQALTFTHGAVWVTLQARPPPGVSTPGSPPAVLRVARESPFQSLDPARMSSVDTDEAQLMYQTCAGLLTYPDRPGAAGTRLVPDVAQRLPTVSADGRTYTFTVRPGFRFSPPSNSPVTAATFKHTIERVLSPGVQGYERGFFGDIVGEGAFNAGKTRHLAGVIAQGDKLQIRLTAPAPDLPARMAMLTFCAVPDDTPDTPQRQPIPSAGPYFITSSTPDQLVLARNPNYRGHRPRIPREIVYSFGVGFAKAVSEVAAGKSDYVTAAQLAVDSDVPPELFQTLERRYGSRSPSGRTGRQQYFVNPTVSLDAFALNTTRGLFASTRLREAFNYAIDRQELVAAAGPYFGGEPISHYLPPGMPGSRALPVYPLGRPNLAKARKLAGDIHARATMLTCNITACVQIAQIVQSDLRAIGITLDVTSLPIDAMYTQMSNLQNPWDIGWETWSMDYADPSDFMSGLFDPSLGQELGGFDQRRWIKAIRSTRTLSGQRRLQTYGRLDDRLASQAAPAVAWATEAARDFFASRVGCELYQPIYGMDLGAICFRS
jgi:peptide/nickel transport system substrate-binding protein